MLQPPECCVLAWVSTNSFFSNTLAHNETNNDCFPLILQHLDWVIPLVTFRSVQLNYMTALCWHQVLTHTLCIGWKAVWCTPGWHWGSCCIKPSFLHIPTGLHGCKFSCWHIWLQWNTFSSEITKDISLWFHVSLQIAVRWFDFSTRCPYL